MAQTAVTFEFTEELLKKIESLAAQGLTQEQIAHVIDLHPNTLSSKKKEVPELAEAIKKGRAKGVATITNSLFTKAKSGDNVSMIFFLKNRDPENWKDRVDQTMNINATISPEQWLEHMSEDDEAQS